MVDIQGSATFAQGLPPTPGGHGWGMLSAVGLGGLALEFKHGTIAILAPFHGCTSLWDVLARLGAMEDTTFLGLGLYVAILIASTLALFVSVRRLVRKRRTTRRGQIATEQSPGE